MYRCQTVFTIQQYTLRILVRDFEVNFSRARATRRTAASTQEFEGIAEAHAGNVGTFLVHDEIQNFGLGGNAHVLEFELAFANLVVSSHIVVPNSNGQYHVVQARDLPLERFTKRRRAVVSFVRRFFPFKMFVEQIVVLFQFKRHVWIGFACE